MEQKIYNINPSGKSIGKIVIGIIIAILVIIAVSQCFTIVDAGHSGVVLTFQQVQGTVLTEGLHFKIPFAQSVVQVDNRVQKAEATCSSASKDLQTISSVIAVNYKVLNDYSQSVYKNIGRNYVDVIITPAIQECVKAVTARYTAEELITKRQQVSEEMREELIAKISSYGFEIQVFNIITFDFSAEYNAAIEAKQTAQQNALKAEQDLQRVRVEAEQTVAKAQAEADSYNLKSAEITPEILLMNYIDKWDGKLPVMVSGDGQVMLDVSALLSEITEETAKASAPTVTPPVVTEAPPAVTEAPAATETTPAE
ncbi:MAG: prohibitin family protein [Ruminococcus sp.]|jgi:regulator of protease activity HflC (stomatin/prohibitin superfamily)|nr:prohibitin family protein [Ruminococcus sp.]